MTERERRRTVRCAIYTRKSTEEGLEQEFNSLDAQHEACAAYVASQRHEGWRLTPERYDDGGISGGTLDRPGLQHLLAAIDAGEVTMIVVYKIDRLTRSLADFAKLVERFDAAGCSFVSVTQSFNTSTSMGRLTLNVLLSFAQFEREVTAERIRDKIAASKKRGIWMGGTVPLGYRAADRRLVIDPEEAALVRRIFERYLALGSVRRLKAELDSAGLRTPERVYPSGRQSGGAAFSRGKLYAMLSNPIYVGRIRHKSTVHPGQHEPIVEDALWRAIQERLASSRQSATSGTRGDHSSPLAGRVVDPAGRSMRPSHAMKRGRRYRYYISAELIEGSIATGARGWRVPADEIEGALGQVIAARLRDPYVASALIGESRCGTSDAHAFLARIGEVADRLADGPNRERSRLLRSLVCSVRLSETSLQAEVAFDQLGAGIGTDDDRPFIESTRPICIEAPIRLVRRGAGLRLVLQGAAASRAVPDPKLVSTIITARRLLEDYADPAQRRSVTEIAGRAGMNTGDASRLLQLAFLAPDIIGRILDGTQSASLTAQRLKRLGDLPLLWDEQRQFLS